MKVAIIGLGNIGSKLAANLAAGGQHVTIADTSLAKAEQLAATLAPNATPAPIDAAIGAADVVIPAIPFEAIKQLILTHHGLLAGKLVVDPSNPIAPDGQGGFKKVIPANQSSGQIIARLLPEGAELAKAFGTLGAESLSSGAHRAPEPAVLFYATDYPEAGRIVSGLITASGFAPVSVGGLDQAIRIEVGGDLHEYGKLGRLVSADEAKALLAGTV